MAEYGRQVPAVVRALDLLEALASRPEGWTAGDLQEVVEGSRSALFAHLNTLKDRRWVAQDSSGAYLLGSAVRRLAPVLDIDDDGLRRALDDALQVVPLDESVALVRSDGAARTVVATYDGPQRVRCAYRIGESREGTAADAVVLGIVPDPALDDAEEVRTTGLARSSDDEAVELASPVCPDGHHPAAALVVGVPRQRADAERLERAGSRLRHLAAEASSRLGAPTWQPWGTAGRDGVGPSRVLDREEVEALLTGRHGAQLACLREDGSPHVVPLWFDWDGRWLWLTASPGASWAQYVGTGSRVSLTIEEPWPALRRVFVTGWAEPLEADEVADLVEGGLAGLRRRLVGRHLAPGATTVAACTGEGWTAIRVAPERIHGRAGLSVAAA